VIVRFVGICGIVEYTNCLIFFSNKNA